MNIVHFMHNMITTFIQFAKCFYKLLLNLLFFKLVIRNMLLNCNVNMTLTNSGFKQTVLQVFGLVRLSQ